MWYSGVLLHMGQLSSAAGQVHDGRAIRNRDCVDMSACACIRSDAVYNTLFFRIHSDLIFPSPQLLSPNYLSGFSHGASGRDLHRALRRSRDGWTHVEEAGERTRRGVLDCNTSFIPFPLVISV
jgi:hypothetical protein